MNYRYPDACIVVMCKAPVAGEVKTRLMPQLSAQLACDAHIELTQRLLRGLNTARLAPIELWVSPDSHHPFFADCVEQFGVTLHKQVAGDLGVKMAQAIRSSLTRSRQVVLLGCDCPSLQIEDICFAIEALSVDEDVVLGPTEDGGYALMACQQSHGQLFEGMTWSTDSVLKQTRKQALATGLQLIETQQQWDVDTFADWQRFCALDSRKMMT